MNLASVSSVILCNFNWRMDCEFFLRSIGFEHLEHIDESA